MQTRCRWIVPAVLAAVALSAAPLAGRTRETAIVESAVTVLDEIMAIPVKRIPRELLADARGVAIVPDVIKVGFIAGVRRGHGVVLIRDETGAWEPPQFVTLTGGSVGWQAGLQATDVILVFKTRRSIEGLMRGKFTLGADAAAAAGPVGRQAAAATDARLKAEIYSYSRARGLFAGVSLDGSALQIDAMANRAYYGGGEPGQPVPVPESAVKLLHRLAWYTASPEGGTVVGIDEAPPGTIGQALQAPSIRQELAAGAGRLYALLDDPWKQYLALPAELFSDDRPLPADSVRASLARFDTVARQPRYRALTERPEFQLTHRLLRRYLEDPGATNAPLSDLPPPPGGSAPNSGPALHR